MLPFLLLITSTTMAVQFQLSNKFYPFLVGTSSMMSNLTVLIEIPQKYWMVRGFWINEAGLRY